MRMIYKNQNMHSIDNFKQKVIIKNPYCLIKKIIKRSQKMTEKNLLISSMQKLINHIRKSQANQQEIFYSLSRNDFKKILSNLQDDNILLRKTSLNLIAQLMSGNSKLKRKFCKTMDVNLIPGKILFNSKTIEKHVASTNFSSLLTLLKKQVDSVQIDCLLWYINLNHKNRQLQTQYVFKDKTKIQMQIDIDPQQCIVGFCLSPVDLQSQFSTANLSMTASQVSQSSKMLQLKNLIQPNPKKLTFINQKINSSMSDSQPKYQRNNKTMNNQTDRPKKFINNFVQQRKNQSFKGNQTQRHSTLNAQNTHYIPRQTFQSMQIQRSTMPKATQSPYIPTLNLQNSSKNGGYNTDRIDSYTTTNNRSREMDFQKVKYQGIKLTSTTNQGNRTSYGNQIGRNTDRDNPSSGTINSIVNRKEVPQNSFNFKYIKPLTTTNQEGIKFVNFFQKKPQQHSTVPLVQKKTIDVYQYIKNR